MPNYEKLRENLKNNGFQTSFFATAKEAADYLDGALDGKTIGLGGSQTLQALDIAARLGRHNHVVSHTFGDSFQSAAGTEIYISSLNGVAETGELINIDGTGNRVSSGLFGHEKVIFVVGSNKIAPTFDAALARARNVAAPKNAQRLKRETPCAAKGDRCYNCQSDQRICRALVVYWRKPTSAAFEVVLVGEELGF